MRTFIISIFFSLTTLNVSGQAFNRFKFEEPWSVALHLGPTQYFGDLYSLWKYNEGIQPDYNAGFSGRYTFGTNLKARADVVYYQISGQDDLADPRSGRIPRKVTFKARN